MKNLAKLRAFLLIYFLGMSIASADNQTADVSTVLPVTGLPFRVVIEQANFQLPTGFHSGAVGVYKGLWIFIAGRINGMHGFNPTGDFPADQQNTSIYVVNPTTGVTMSRSLSDPSSGLSQAQVDSLSVTSPESFNDETTLYIAGGYGIDTATNTFSTKSTFTAVNLPGIVDWVTHPENPNFSVIKNISQISNPIFQITGGRLFKIGNTFMLAFGQTFTGNYTPGSNGNYSDQVRKFQLSMVGGQMTATILPSLPTIPDDVNFRRRDLNIVPVLLNHNNLLQYGLVAYSGVFTLTSGVWTVPVVIDSNGTPSMADPNLSTTFKQAMNQYACATIGLYSKRTSSMYNIFFGGISYGFFTNGVFSTDSEIPFINQVTTIKMDKNGNFSQYLMDGQYPTILSTQSNPGNTLLFGAGAYFLPTALSQYPNKVLNLDGIRQRTVIGYIVGGIQSTLANTNTMSDSAASPYVFKVTLIPT